MAKVTITFEDAQDGTIQTNMEFDPTIKATDQATPAQRLAIVAMETIMRTHDHDDPVNEYEED